MQTYIALFRGINVGGKHIIPMKALRSLLEKLGCKAVKTYIQSGNVVLQTNEKSNAKLAGIISSKIDEQFGFSPKVMLLDISEFETAIANNPFPTTEGKALHFFFLVSAPQNPNFELLDGLKKESESYKLENNVFYLYAPDGIGRSKLVEKIDKALGVQMTARNWNTVNKLIQIVRE